MTAKTIAIYLAVGAFYLAASPVHAQDDQALARSGLFVRDRNVAVTERSHPGYEPIPVPLGAFVAAPSIVGSAEYNDNIYATKTNTVDDEIFRVQPDVIVASNWNVNEVSAYARASVNRYASHGSEDTTDAGVGASGRLDIRRDLGVAGGASYEYDTQPRTGAGNQLLSVHPVRFFLGTAFGEATKEYTHLRLTGRFDVTDIQFENGRTASNLIVYEKDQSHTTYIASGKAEYAISPAISIIGQVSANSRDFRDPFPGTPLRNSDGYEFDVGSSFDITHLVRGEVAVGYTSQNFDSRLYTDVSGFALHAGVFYFPTELTTVTLSANRSVLDSAIIGTGGYFETSVSLGVDHELRRNVILSASFGYANDDYQGINRTDDRFAETLGLQYLLNRALSLNATYTHIDQNSSGTAIFLGQEYAVNRIVGALTYRF